MKIYNVLTKDNFKYTFFIEESFSFFALIFQSLWLLYHKLWFQGTLILLIQYAIFKAVNTSYISTEIGLSLELIIATILAIFAKTWYIEKMKKNDYQLDIIVAKNIDEAKFRFYQLTMDQKNVRQE